MVKGVKLLSLSLLIVALFSGVTTTQRVERNISVVVADPDGPPPT